MPESISSNDAQYAFNIVKAICDQIGPGVPASPQERQRAEYIKKELSAHLGPENVVMEEFTLAPGTLLNTYPGVACMLVAILLNIFGGRIGWISPWIPALLAFLFSLFMPVSFIVEFLLGREVLDWLFPKKTSINVIGRLHHPGSAGIKRQLIISGHHDSAPENTWLRFIGFGFFIFSGVFFIGALLLPVMCLVQFLGVLFNSQAMVGLGTIGWVVLVFPIIPAMFYALFLTRGKKNGGIVPGAADNLSACGVVVAMSRYLAQHPSEIPDDTEVRFITFGSEEVGLRGSRRFVARHLEELKRLDVRVLNYEIIAYPEISILEREVNGTVKCSPEVIKSAMAAAQRAGVPHKIGSGGLGSGSDAAPFLWAGLKATTLQAFKTPEQLIAFYHQDRDTPAVLTIEPLMNVLKLTLEWIRARGE
jgi:Peptidase family M28